MEKGESTREKFQVDFDLSLNGVKVRQKSSFLWNKISQLSPILPVVFIPVLVPVPVPVPVPSQSCTWLMNTDWICICILLGTKNPWFFIVLHSPFSINHQCAKIRNQKSELKKLYRKFTEFRISILLWKRFKVQSLFHS